MQGSHPSTHLQIIKQYETVRLLAHLGAKFVDDAGTSVTEYLHRPRDKERFGAIISAGGDEGTPDSQSLRVRMLKEMGLHDCRDGY